jgi:hypothetical protein
VDQDEEPASNRWRAVTASARRACCVSASPDEARVDAQAALTLAGTDAERHEAQEVLDAIAKSEAGRERSSLIALPRERRDRRGWIDYQTLPKAEIAERIAA